MVRRQFSSLIFALTLLAPLAGQAQLWGPAQPAPKAPATAYLNGQAAQQGVREQCELRTTSSPPFYASMPEAKTPGARFEKNFAQMMQASNSSAVAGYIPANSIVKPTRPDSVASYFDPRSYVGLDFVEVDVISTPNEKTDQNARQSPADIANNVVGRGARLNAGFRGSIQRRYLKPAGDVAFIVKQNAPALVLPNGHQLALGGRAIRLSRTGGYLGGRVKNDYNVNRCCAPTPSGQQKCHDNYIFEIINPANGCTAGKFTLGSPFCDGFTANLRPVSHNTVAAVATLAKLNGQPSEQAELIDEMGLYKAPVDPSGRMSFNGSHSFRNTAGGSEAGRQNSLALSFDAFMDPWSSCAYTRVREAFQKFCGGGDACKIHSNDAFHPWGHKSHGKKTCIDVFPISKTARQGGSIRYNDANYDRAKTFKLIQLMIDAGAERDQLFFSDPQAVRMLGTKPLAGHDNHVHVCFPSDASSPEGAKVHNACQNGIGSAAPVARNPSFVGGMFGFAQPKCQ